jgi:TRAP-type C4-dicarboxylate transport system permease small subunit
MQPVSLAQRAIRFAERTFVGTMMLACIAVMLTGVFLRYVMVPITDALDLNAISFFWVEETGETLLSWLALVGAAIGIAERTHFTVAFLVHKLSPPVQRVVHIFNLGVTAIVGGVLAWQAWNLVKLNQGLDSPALGISLGWSYGAAVAGGILIVVYAIKTINEPPSLDPIATNAIKAE